MQYNKFITIGVENDNGMVHENGRAKHELITPMNACKTMKNDSVHCVSVWGKNHALAAMHG